jgi:cobalt/nickel transport system permease protein
LHGTHAAFAFTISGFELAGYREGLAEGLLIASRITGAVVVVTALSFSTPFTELMAAFAWLRVPREFIEIALFAWRYMFMLFDDERVIYSAQKNRLGYLNCRQGVRSFGTLTGSLVVKAFDNSRNITTAMEQRGYDGAMPMLKHVPFKAVEVSASITFLVCMAMLWNI